jgi:hypothetical protein
MEKMDNARKNHEEDCKMSNSIDDYIYSCGVNKGLDNPTPITYFAPAVLGPFAPRPTLVFPSSACAVP